MEGPRLNGIQMPPRPVLSKAISLNPFDDLLGEGVNQHGISSQTGGTLNDEEEGFDDF